jgi:hypothetical protein
LTQESGENQGRENKIRLLLRLASPFCADAWASHASKAEFYFVAWFLKGNTWSLDGTNHGQAKEKKRIKKYSSRTAVTAVVPAQRLRRPRAKGNTHRKREDIKSSTKKKKRGKANTLIEPFDFWIYVQN